MAYEVGEPSGEGALIPVNLTSLIEQVFVSPTSEKWFKAVVEGIVGKYGLATPVRQSALSATPLY
jgi:hypothetical protein